MTHDLAALSAEVRVEVVEWGMELETGRFIKP